MFMIFIDKNNGMDFDSFYFLKKEFEVQHHVVAIIPDSDF